MFIGWLCFGKLFYMVVVCFCFIARAFLTDESQKIAHVHIWFWPCRYQHLQQQKPPQKKKDGVAATGSHFSSCYRLDGFTDHPEGFVVGE